MKIHAGYRRLQVLPFNFFPTMRNELWATTMRSFGMNAWEGREEKRNVRNQQTGLEATVR